MDGGARLRRDSRHSPNLKNHVSPGACATPSSPPAPSLTLTLTRDLAMVRVLASLLTGTSTAKALHVMVRVCGSVGMRAATATCDWCDSSLGPLHALLPSCATANPNPNSGSGDGEGAHELAPWHRHRTGTTCDGAGARISRHARRDRDMRLVRLVARPSPRPPAPPLIRALLLGLFGWLK